MNIMWNPIAGSSETTPYSDRLQFGAELVAQVKAALHLKIWRGTGEEGRTKLADMCADICRVLGIRMPGQVIIGGMANFVGPHYVPDTGNIVLDKVSLTSFLHELAHHVAHSSDNEELLGEGFPRMFSLGLFKAAAPMMFEKARSDGKLMFCDVAYRGRPEPAGDLPADDVVSDGSSPAVGPTDTPMAGDIEGDADIPQS